MAIKPSLLSREARMTLLAESYQNVIGKKGLLDLIEEVKPIGRGSTGIFSLKATRLIKIFNSRSWRQERVSSGHHQFINLVTKTRVGFSCRTEIPPKVAAIIASNLQEHVSILEKNIFSLGSWDQKPNYNEAEQRWVSWCKNEKTIANGK